MLLGGKFDLNLAGQVITAGCPDQSHPCIFSTQSHPAYMQPQPIIAQESISLTHTHIQPANHLPDSASFIRLTAPTHPHRHSTRFIALPVLSVERKPACSPENGRASASQAVRPSADG